MKAIGVFYFFFDRENIQELGQRQRHALFVDVCACVCMSVLLTDCMEGTGVHVLMCG